MKDFTVIGCYDETRQIFAHHVTAASAMQAFYLTAKDYSCASLIVALDGFIEECEGMAFPGFQEIDSDEVLRQPDVFDVE